MRRVKPVTHDDVPKVLHDALSEAVQGKVRGVVVLLCYHEGLRMEHMTAGTMSISETSYLMDAWKWRQHQEQFKP